MKEFEEILKNSSNWIKGIPASPGIFIGKAYIYTKEKLEIKHGEVNDVDEAIKSFKEAIQRSSYELNKIFGLAREKMGDQRASIFEAQLMILEDPQLINSIEQRIISERREPEFIVYEVFNKYLNVLYASAEPYMKERALDIDDIMQRLIRNLQKKRWVSRIQNDAIVVSKTLTPADTILFSRNNVKGYITEHGGLTSHAAIIARSLDIPAVLGAINSTSLIDDGSTIIIDGFHGYCFFNPSESQLKYFKAKQEKIRLTQKKLEGINSLPAVTTDGKEIKLYSNVDISGEIENVTSCGSEGIGLYRTEQLIEELGEFPDEEVQERIYSDLAAKIYPLNITIRAFDLGGDKTRLFHPHEANPFLGLRGVRFLLENEELFRMQIRAVLKASVNKNVKFMIPMISTISEVKKCNLIIKECMAELDSKGINYDSSIQTGIMIEVPAAAVMARSLAKETDFFSIGTNDLIQYLMAVDRGNDTVALLYQEFNPAVLMTLKFISEAAISNKLPFSICGEMAADPMAVPVLIGLGFESLSLSPSGIPVVKQIIRSLSYSKCVKLIKKLEKLESEKEILDTIEQFFITHKISRNNLIF